VKQSATKQGGSPDRQGAGKARKKRRLRDAIGRKFMTVPLLRRWYIRRMLKYIDKSREKGRPLPEGLTEVARYLSRVPKYDRAKKFEEAIKANQEVEDAQAMGRELRRATSRQRKSGKSGGYRPGLPPGALKQGGRTRPR
jgi:hypothetical protein